MALFLRDQQIRNAVVDEETLRHFVNVIETRTAANNVQIQEPGPNDRTAIATYVIRFDGKGYRIGRLDELLNYFRNAREVERIIFSIDTGTSIRTNRLTGTYLEVRFDAKELNNCYFIATSDENDWVEASTNAVQEALLKCKGKIAWLANAWTQLIVQVAGLFLLFVLSLWLASKIAPRLAIDDSIVVALLFVILILSHLWTFLNQRLILAIHNMNVRFSRPKDRWQWLIQGALLAVGLPAGIWILGKAASGFGDILSGLIRKGH